MPNVPITFAVAHYDRHVPFLDGTVTVQGVDLTVLDVGQSSDGKHGRHRHQRMLKNGEWDVAEVSFSNYIMARARGAEFTAIPVIPRRLFSQSLMFTRLDSPITGPGDLVGKRIGLNTYQTTLSVLAKGDLAHEYGVPLDAATWVINLDEIIPFDPPPGIRIERLDAAGRRIDELLLAGDIDALVMPHPPASLRTGEPKIRRVFPDARAAEVDYFRRLGYWPIMHFIVFRKDVTDRHPWLPRAMWDAYADAKRMLGEYYGDPNWSAMVWAPHYREEEARVFGDPWRHGLAANRANIERFMGYSTEQGLMPGPLPIEQLFHESVLDT